MRGEKDTAEWLAHEFDGGDGKTPFAVRPESPNGTMLPWPKVQRRIAQLIKEDRFYTQEEQDRFDNTRPHRHPGSPGRARHRERPGGRPRKS